MNKFYSFLIAGFILITAIFFACTKTESLSGQYNPGPVVTASVKGRITGIDKRPIIGATISAGSTTTTTNINGEFTLNNVQLNKNSGFIKVSKQGYFNGSRTFTVSANTTNFIRVQLIPKTVSGSFNSNSGGTVTVSNGGEISFTASSIKNASTGAAHTGNVKVSAFYLDPTDVNMSQYMPGDLRGINTSNQERLLKSFGMIAVELNADNGDPLQLANGKTATINFPIPPSLQTNAPATIPLWYFNETKGMWMEEGTATKQGDKYIGTVGHFSFWNFDEPQYSTNINMRFVDANANPLSYYWVEIKDTTNNNYRMASTDSAGYVSGPVPCNKVLSMKVYSPPPSYELIYQTTIGPFGCGITQNLGTINISVTPVSHILTGAAVDCNNNPVANGYISLEINGAYMYGPITNGSFSIPFTLYDTGTFSSTLLAVNETTNERGPAINYLLTGQGNHNAGQIPACGGGLNQYIYFSIVGQNFSWLTPADTLEQLYSSISGYTQLNGYRSNYYSYPIMSIKWIGPPATGVIPMFTSNAGMPTLTTSFVIDDPGNLYYLWGTPYVNITEYGPTGGYISGNFTANFFKYDQNNYPPVNPPVFQGICSFRVRRRN